MFSMSERERIIQSEAIVPIPYGPHKYGEREALRNALERWRGNPEWNRDAAIKLVTQEGKTARRGKEGRNRKVDRLINDDKKNQNRNLINDT